MIILFISVQLGKFFFIFCEGSEYQETYRDFSLNQRNINGDEIQIQIFFKLLFKQKRSVMRNQNSENGFKMHVGKCFWSLSVWLLEENLAKGEVFMIYTYFLINMFRVQLWYGFEGLRVLNQAKSPGLPHHLQKQGTRYENGLYS